MKACSWTIKCPRSALPNVSVEPAHRFFVRPVPASAQAVRRAGTPAKFEDRADQAGKEKESEEEGREKVELLLDGISRAPCQSSLDHEHTSSVRPITPRRHVSLRPTHLPLFARSERTIAALRAAPLARPWPRSAQAAWRSADDRGVRRAGTSVHVAGKKSPASTASGTARPRWWAPCVVRTGSGRARWPRAPGTRR